MANAAQYVGTMESCNVQMPVSCSVKKLKREAAQRRKAQARLLKVRAEEQERLQRLEIDALVEQQRLQRLERQRCKEEMAQENRLLHQSSSDGKVRPINKHLAAMEITRSEEKKQKDISLIWVREKESVRVKHGQQQNQIMRAAAESRRRLARGPRSGVVVSDSPSTAMLLPLEDHRVVSIEYQASSTQALMRVTLLAAGFVIGSRGISARLIGQTTGAMIQSWTDSCREDSIVPMRLFRIQGKKAVVQAAVSLIEQAVRKYKDLCDCKRRGEFVQREHLINGVEFYYQPPPRKAFSSLALAAEACRPKTVPPPSGHGSSQQLPLPFGAHQVWFHQFHAKQQQTHLPSPAQEQVLKQQESQAQKDKMNVVKLELQMDQGHCVHTETVTSLEQAMQQVRLDQLHIQASNTGANDCTVREKRLGNSVTDSWSNITRNRTPIFPANSSLFSVFGNGGLPLPIAQDCRSNSASANVIIASTPMTPFDFPKYDFLRESLSLFPWTPAGAGQLGSITSNYGQHPHNNPAAGSQDHSMCVVCFERVAGVRVMVHPSRRSFIA
ncbi:hypothetical protein O6H91_Y318200 [Diphasiastrum complanatum]|nr:hypothetical protein O6H91_Y318200 [Diphasiastrum complanatum]